MKYEICKLFFKSKVSIALALIFFIVTYGFILFFQSLGMTAFSLLHTVARYNFYLCFFIVCMTYYFFSAANRNYVKEASDALSYCGIYEWSAFLILLIYTILWNLGMCIILMCCSVQNDGTYYFIHWFPDNYLYNILLPQIICILFTFLVSASWNTTRWLMVEILFVFLISPFAEDIVWRKKPEIPVDSLWDKIRWPFQILYQNGEWSPDYQNDFQLENVRICLLLFWVFILLCVGMLSIWKKKSIGFIFGIVSLSFLYFSYQPASLYRLNEKWNGLNEDYTHYSVNIEDNVYRMEEPPAYSVTDYNLDLSFQNELNVEGRLTLEALIPCKEFTLTLYHGYKVKELCSETEGITLQFQQKGDYILVSTDEDVTQIDLYICYTGHHKKFYSNSRAAMLPGWFPWYPMAGIHQVVLEYPEYGKMWGYNPYNRIQTAHVCIKSSYPVITNLFDIGNNTYEGNTDGITVLGGNLEKADDDEIIDYLPLQLYSGYGVQEFVEKQKTEFNTALKNLKEIYGIAPSNYEDKVILFASKDMGRNVTNNFFSVFDEYILATPGYLSVNEMIHYLILADKNNAGRRQQSGMIQLFINSNFEDDTETIVECWINEIRKRQEYPDFYYLEIENQEMLLDILCSLDSKVVVKECVQYILQPDYYGNDREFLEIMRNKL